MRRIHAIVVTALAVYALCLGIAWEFGRRWQDRKTERLLHEAIVDFSERLENLINCVQWFQSAVLFDEIGGRTNATTRSIAEMRRLAERYYVDEFNIVSTNGVVIASNLPNVLGDDWHRNQNTAEFLKLLLPETHRWRLSQPFRHGTINPEYYCTYHAEVFDDYSGILQLGYSMDRLAQNLVYSDGTVFEQWEIGRHGYYSIVDNDGNGQPDKAPLGVATCPIERVVDDGESVYRQQFAYAGRMFEAVVPELEYGGERYLAFFVFAVTSGFLILVFAGILLLLARSNRRIASLRRQADARRAEELASARTIQLSSLPTVDRFRKAMFSFSFAAATCPAREVGGDFYDFYFVDTAHLMFVVADVAGKGIAAAMFMMRAKNEIANALGALHDLPAAVAMANARICEHNEAELFVTAWIGVIDVNSGEVEYVNAGHNRPFVRRADGRIEKIMGRGGLILGTFADAKYRAHHFMLKPGDSLFVYTDGVTEAMDSEKRTYGEERLRRQLAAVEPDPDRILERVSKSVCEFADGAEQSDDLTVMALVWHGVPELRSRTFVAAEDSLGAAVEWLRQAIELKSGKAKARLVNAVDEIMSNIVSYSGTAEFTITVENSLGRSRIACIDAGREYNPLLHADPDTHASLDDRPEGGLGILMTKRLVDSVGYTRDGGRNILRLVKLDA